MGMARKRDILVAPILMAGQSPYHMGFAGTITLSAETILQVHLEAIVLTAFCSLFPEFWKLCMYRKSTKVAMTELIVLLEMDSILTIANSPGFLKNSGNLLETFSSVKKFDFIEELVPLE